MRALIVLAIAGCGRVGFDAVGGGASGDAGPSGTREVVFVETFDDASFAARGWYDGPSGQIDTGQHAPGSTSSLRCDWTTGLQRCMQGAPRRHQLPEAEAIHVSYWIKNGAELDPYVTVSDLMTNQDDALVGPDSSHLTAAVAAVQGAVSLELTDTRNVDPTCVKLTNGTVLGCGGNFDGYPFTEARSVCACNGLAGDVQGWQCEGPIGSEYLSRRSWLSATTPFGVPYDSQWHFLEIELRMNSIVGGAGQPDGVFRVSVDGVLVLASERVLFRTAIRATMAWNQILLEPFLLAPATTAQTMWLDDLTVSRVL